MGVSKLCGSINATSSSVKSCLESQRRWLSDHCRTCLDCAATIEKSDDGEEYDSWAFTSLGISRANTQTQAFASEAAVASGLDHGSRGRLTGIVPAAVGLSMLLLALVMLAMLISRRQRFNAS